MSFPVHSEYQDCGHEWLGKLPKHWDTLPNKVLFRRIKTEVGSDWNETQLLSLTLRGVVVRDIESGDGKYPSDFSNYQIIEPDDLVFCLFDMDETPRTVGLSEHQGMITGAYDVFRCNGLVSPGYVYYFYRHIDAYKKLRPFYTGLRKTVRTPRFLSIKMPVPPLDEQTAIASFLDVESSKIDALVAEQRRLVELLKEKRQVVISHAVTKGLNPNAPMKPSGIEWLGDVPRHWTLIKLKLLTQIGNGSTPDRKNPKYWSEGTYPWLNSSVVNEAMVTEASQFVTWLALEECHLPRIEPPAVLVGITGQGRTRGMATILETEATINQHIAYLKPLDDRTTVSFIHRFFQMAYDYIRDESEGAGSTKGAITCGQLEKLKMPLPPTGELTEITKHLDAETETLTQLEAETERAIELLQERRTALISAAVTGKIDIREFAYQESA